MPDFPTLYSAYRNAQTPLSLRDFSKFGNFMTDSNQFDTGTGSTFGELVKKGSYWTDKAVNATGAPAFAGQQVGNLFDTFGVDRAKGVELGQSIPRTAAEWGGAGLAAFFGAPEMVALAIPAALGAANAYEKTDSGGSAATAAAMPYVGSLAGNFAASQTAKLFGWGSEELASSAAKRVGSYLASQAGATGAMEGINTAQTGALPDVTSKEYWLGLAAQQLPFAAFDAKRIFTKPKIEALAPNTHELIQDHTVLPEETPQTTPSDTSVNSPEALQEAQVKIETSRKAALESVLPITNEEEKTKAIVSINQAHDELTRDLGLGNKPVSEKPEGMVGAVHQTFGMPEEAKAFAESLSATHEVQTVVNDKTNSTRVYYKKKPVVELLPEAPEIDVVGKPEEVVKTVTELGKKDEMVSEYLKHMTEGNDSARAAELASNKVVQEAVKLPTEEAKNKGGRPSKTNEVEQLFSRLVGDEAVDTRDAEFRQAIKDTGLAREVQDNSRAVDAAQGNKGLREFALGYNAWKEGVKWRGMDMAKLNAKNAAEFIKIHVKRGNARPPTSGAKELGIVDQTAKADEEFFDAMKAADDEADVIVNELAELGDTVLVVDAEEVKQGKSVAAPVVEATSEENLGFALRFGQSLEEAGMASENVARLKWANWRLQNKPSAERLKALAAYLKVPEKDIGPALLKKWLEHPDKDKIVETYVNDQPDRVFRLNNGSEIRVAKSILNQLQTYDSATQKLGKHSLAEQTITEAQFKLIAGKTKQLSEVETSQLKALAPESFADGKVDVAKLYQAISSNELKPVDVFRLGTKLEGLAPTFETMFYRLSRKAGIADKEAQAMLPSFRKFVDAAGMGDVQFGELVRDSLVRGKDIKGMATTMGEKTRKMWLATLDASDKVGWSRSMMTLIAHENGHLVDHLYNSGQLVSARAKKAYENMLKWKDTATPQELTDTMQLAADMLLPKDWQKMTEMKELLSIKDGTEALATLHGIFALSAHSKSFDSEIGMALMPAGPRGFLRTLAEYGRSFVQVLKNLMYLNGQSPKARQLRELQENFKQLQKGVTLASENLVKMQKFMSFDPSDYTQIKLSTLEAMQDRSLPSDVKQIARFAAFDGEKKVEESQLLNAPKGLVGSLMRGASYFMEPLDSLTARVPKFAQVGNAILQTPATAKRYIGEFLEPLYGERDPVTKQVTAGSKEQQEMIRMWNEDAGVNSAINKIELWQNKNKKVLDYGSADAEFLKAMTPAQRNAAIAFVEKKKVAVVVQQRRIIETVDKVSHNQLAEKIASTKPELHDSSMVIARNIKDAMEMRGTQDPMQMQMADRLLMEAADQVNDPRIFPLYVSMAEKQTAAMGSLKGFFKDKEYFHSYVRTGKWAIDAWDKSGKQIYHTLPAKTNAEAIALEKQLRSEGYKTNIKQLSKGKFVKVDEELQAMLENVDDRLKRSFMDQFSAQVDPVQLEEFFKKNSFSGTLKQYSEVAERFEPTSQGRNLKGAEHLDVVAMELEQAGLMANTLAKMESGSKLAWAKTNPALKAPDMQHWMQQFDAAWEQYHVPDNQLASKVSKAISTYSLGMNVGNMIAEGFQPMTTVMTEAIANSKGLGAFRVTRMMAGVMKDVGTFYAKGTANKLTMREEFNTWKDSGERAMLDTLGEEGSLHNGSYTEAMNAEDQNMLAWKLKARSGKNWATSFTRKLGDYSMQMYQTFSRHNSRVTALMGYRLGKAQGMDHEAAVDFTKRFLERAALTSTRAVRPVGMFAENTRAVGQLASVMQRYNLGWLAMAARHIQRGWLLSDAQAAGRGFDQVSKRDAQKAALYMMGSQLAAAGALGLPFMGAMAKGYQKLTGNDLKADAYQKLAELTDEDANESGFWSDGLMRGFGNAMLNRAGVPIDLGSRFSIGGLPGMSEYAGFDAGSVFGPTGGMIKTIATGVESLAKDGDVMRAGKTLMPPGLRKLFDVAINGDMTDNNGNRMGLTSQEKLLYGLGFTPDRIRKLRDFEQMSQNITANRRQTQDKVEAEIADMMRTNPGEAQAKLHEAAQKLGVTPKELAAGVAQRVVKTQTAKDFRDSIPAVDAQQAIRLMRGLGADFGPSGETQKAQLRNATLSRLGVAPNLRDMMTARMADQRLAAEPYQPTRLASNKHPSSRGLTAEQLLMQVGQ